MNDADVRSYESFQRMRAFAGNEPARLAANDFVADLFARLSEIMSKMDAHASAQSTGQRTSQQGVSGTKANGAKLLTQLRAISRTARVMEAQTPGVVNLFRVPPNLKRQELVNLARTFNANAAPLKTEFVKRGLPAAFLETLDASVAALEASINQKIQGAEARVTATAAIKELVEQGQEVRTELDTIMRNLLTDDAPTLAAWTSASHIEHAPHKRKKADAKPPA